MRWTLLFWYALILTGALAVFASVLHDEMERAMYRGADQEVEALLRTATRELDHGRVAALPLILPEGTRYAVWTSQGQVVASSALDAERPRPNSEATSMHEDVRGRARRLADGGWLWIAKDVSAEHARVRRFLNVLLAAGFGVLVLALGGGWFLITRALRPIARMTKTAQRISSDRLDERIDLPSVHNELGGLAMTLNETFERLEESFDRQARFTADASHELRTPLTILLSHLELAERKDRSEDELRKRIETCLKAARRMRSIVEGLLALARIDAGEVQLEREDVDALALCREVVSGLDALTAERRVDVSIHGDRACVQADREKLRVAIENLVTNAIRYNAEGGRVDVELRCEDSHFTIVVRDHGEGIPEADLPHIFDRFYRVDRTRSREKGGSGLGLAITKWIVDAHGGTIDVSSQVGLGTEVTLRLRA